MKQIPILYSTPMIQAKLAGRKTVTRRIIKIKHLPNKEIGSIHPDGSGTGWVAWSPRPVSAEETKRCYPGADGFKCRYGQSGDIHWVRECFINDADYNKPPIWVFKADNENFPMSSGQHWKPSIHMPKSAARIWERLISVRPERLQDITEEDAVREGIEPVPYFDSGEGVYPWQKYKNYLPDGYREVTAIDSFKSLWISINGPDSWAANPWVWRIETEILSTTGRPENL